MAKINGTEKNSSKEKSEKNRAPSKSERIKLLEETIENVLNSFQTLKEEKDQLKNFVITLGNRVLTLEQENIQLKKQAKKPEENYASPSSSKNSGPSNVATASIPTYQDFVRRPSASDISNAEAESFNSRLAKKRKRRKSEQPVYDVSKDGHECTICHKYIKTRVNEHVRIHTPYLLRCPENCGTKERNLKDMIEHLEGSHNMSKEVATDEAFAVMVQICFPNFPLSLPKATTSRPRTPGRSPTPVRPIISKPRCTATPTSSTADIRASTLTSNPEIHIYNINLYNQNPDQQQDQSMSNLLRNFDEDGALASKSPTQPIVTIDSDDEEKEMVSEATNDSTNVEMKRTIGQNVEANQQNTQEAEIIEINQTNIEKNYPGPMDVDENSHEIAPPNQESTTLIHEVSEPFSWDDGNPKEVAPQNFQTLKELFNSGRIDQVNSSLSSAQNSRIFSENSTNPNISQNPPPDQSSPTKFLPHKNKKHRARDDFATSVQYGIKNFENRQEKLNKKICESSSSSDDEEVEEELRRIEMKRIPAEELNLNHMEPEESPNELEKSLVEDDEIENLDLENEHGSNPSSRSSTPDDQEHRFVRIDNGNEGDDFILNSESTETTTLKAPESQFEEGNLENPNDSMIHERINNLKQEQAIPDELEPEEVTIQDEEEILNEEEKRRLSYLTEVDHLINSKNKFMNNSTEEPLNEYESGRTTPEIEESHQSSSSRQILQNPSISVRNAFAPSAEPESLHETRKEDNRRLSRGREIGKPESSKPTDKDIQQALLAKYVRQCRFYNPRTRTGCRDGEKCRFTHGTQMTTGLRDAVDIMNGVKSLRKPPPRGAQRSRSRPRRNSPVRTNRSRSRGRPYSKTRRRSRSRRRSSSRSRSRRSSRPRSSNQHRNRTRGGRREMGSGKSRSRSRSTSKPRNSRDLTKSRSNSPRSRSPKRSRRANRPFTTQSRSRSQEKSETQDENLQISSISSTTRSHPTTPTQVPVIPTQPQKQNDTTIIYAETGRTTPAPTHNTASPENSWPNLSFGAAFGGFVPYKKKSEDATTSNQKIQEYTYDEVKLLIKKAGLFECDYFTRTRRCNYRDNCFKVHWAKENGFSRTEGTLQLQRYLQERLF